MITPLTIDLTTTKITLNESATLRKFAADLKIILRTVLSNEAYRALVSEEREEEQPKIIIKGSKKDIKAFADTLEKEKQYAKDYLEHGLGSEAVSDTKLELEKSIHNFEKTTGIKWPIG